VNIIADPLRYEFFRHALLAATLAGGLTGLVGVYVVLRRMSYIGHGLSHAVFGGAVVGHVLGAGFYLAAGVWGVGAALLVNVLARRRGIGADAAIGIVTTASFALGVALLSRGSGFERNLEAALFGNVLGVDGSDLAALAGTVVAVGLLVLLRHRRLALATFDPEVAPVFGVPRLASDIVMALILAATVIVTMNVLGVTLIAAAIVVPATVARLVARSFAQTLALGASVGTLTGVVGLYASYYADAPSGATIVLTGAALFAVVLTVAGVAGRARRLPRPQPAVAPVRSPGAARP